MRFGIGMRWVVIFVLTQSITRCINTDISETMTFETQKVLDLLKQKQDGMTARQIAKELSGANKKEVNRALYKLLSLKTPGLQKSDDEKPVWSYSEASETNPEEEDRTAVTFEHEGWKINFRGWSDFHYDLKDKFHPLYKKACEMIVQVATGELKDGWTLTEEERKNWFVIAEVAEDESCGSDSLALGVVRATLEKKPCTITQSTLLAFAIENYENDYLVVYKGGKSEFEPGFEPKACLEGKIVDDGLKEDVEVKIRWVEEDEELEREHNDV